jgi:glyoxylase-like metal-dependent hydrolase (beta-lactamase superfamily II)
MRVEKLVVRTDTATWIAAQRDKPAGVFVTHLHLDHVMGMRDLPAGTPVYVGPGEATSRSVEGWLVRSITDEALSRKGTLREWRFTPAPRADAAFDGVIDIFGDGSLWALHVPGHTAGSVAYLARTQDGPVLMTGDACHTAWGWQHGVEPGSFSTDRARSAESLRRLKALVARHPAIQVRLGHQPLVAR